MYELHSTSEITLQEIKNKLKKKKSVYILTHNFHMLEMKLIILHAKVEPVMKTQLSRPFCRYVGYLYKQVV